LRIRIARNTIGNLLAGAGIDAWGVAGNPPEDSLPLSPDLPTAIVVVRRLPAEGLEGLQNGPTPAYRAAYRSLNTALNEATAVLAGMLTSHGHAAERIPATMDKASAAVPQFSHKSAATRAGLGWIGKTALFVSKEFGTGVRLATVFTDLELPPGRPVTSSLCGKCRVCVNVCPAGAGRDVDWIPGMPRAELFDACACEEHMRQAGFGDHGVCGICVGACPRTQAALRRTSRSERS